MPVDRPFIAGLRVCASRTCMPPLHSDDFRVFTLRDTDAEFKWIEYVKTIER